MVDKISPHNGSKADQVLIAAVNQSLDKGLDDIDELNLQRLKNARIKALNHSPVATRKWVPLSVAASVAALLLIPVMMHQYSVDSAIEPELEIVSQEMPISAEEMDDIDMLMTLEGGDA